MNEVNLLNTQSESLTEAFQSEKDGKGKDLVLCAVCLQWTCDGPQCHRPGICEE
jgi:hypothetical protein